MRFSNAELAPFWGAAIRFVPASLLTFLAMAVFRIGVPRGRALTGAAIFGALNFGVSYAFLYFGLQRASAGTASVLQATLPIFAFAFAVLQGLEPLRPRPIVGGLVALAGIALVFIEQIRTDVPPLYLLVILAGAATGAEAAVVAKRFPRTHPLATNAVGLLVGGLIVGALSFVAGEPHVLPELPQTQLTLLYLATVGSIGLFGLFIFTLNRWTVSASSYALVVMPLVAISLGALLRGEPVSPSFVIGAAIVAAGVYIGALSR